VKNNGKEAEIAFAAHWEAIGHVERLRDKKDLMGINKGLKLADFAKPSDFIVSSPNHNLHYAEVKSTTNPTLFSFAKIQPAQSKAALMEASRGSNSYFFYIYSYALGKWFTMHCLTYKVLVDEGHRSVKFEELDEWIK
jgi:hypothetical protein